MISGATSRKIKNQLRQASREAWQGQFYLALSFLVVTAIAVFLVGWSHMPLVLNAAASAAIVFYFLLNDGADREVRLHRHSIREGGNVLPLAPQKILPIPTNLVVPSLGDNHRGALSTLLEIHHFLTPRIAPTPQVSLA